jgi:hypothetical protein
MVKLGYAHRHVGIVVGLHDFEQSYADLYRKSVVHSRKMVPFIAELVQRCAERLHDDPDFLVILKGLWDGLTLRGSVAIDKRVYLEAGSKALSELGLAEKPPIDEHAFMSTFPSTWRRIAAEQPPPEVPTIDEPPAAAARPAPASGWLAKAQQRIVARGLLRGSAASFGALLASVGKRLDR